jgi:hypothetical protein
MIAAELSQRRLVQLKQKPRSASGFQDSRLRNNEERGGGGGRGRRLQNPQCNICPAYHANDHFAINFRGG